jgi:hypothetical protein
MTTKAKAEPELYPIEIDFLTRINLQNVERKFKARIPLNKDDLHVICDTVEDHGSVPRRRHGHQDLTIDLSIDDKPVVTIPVELYDHARFHLDLLEEKTPPGQPKKYDWDLISMIAADVASELYGDDADARKIRAEVQKRYLIMTKVVLPNTQKLRDLIAKAIVYCEAYHQELDKSG